MATLALLAPAPAQAIVYGEPDNGEHPNVGAFVDERTDPDTGLTTIGLLCTGTLVSADVVLTASHCFLDRPAGRGTIYFTLDEVTDADRDGVVDPGIELLTGTPVPHPLYDKRRNNPYDVAVFLLDDSVTGVEPARLAPVGLLDTATRDETFTTVGYGLVRDSRRQGEQGFSRSGRRRQADQHLLSVTKAWATFSINQATGNGGGCYGDSGGPHFLGDVLVSVTALGDTPCKATDRTYRVDTPWSRDFLNRSSTELLDLRRAGPADPAAAISKRYTSQSSEKRISLTACSTASPLHPLSRLDQPAHPPWCVERATGPDEADRVLRQVGASVDAMIPTAFRAAARSVGQCLSAALACTATRPTVWEKCNSRAIWRPSAWTASADAACSSSGPFGGRGCRDGLPTPIPSGDGAGAARDREDDGVDRHVNRVVQLATDQIDCRQQAQRQPALPVPRAASGHASAAVAAVNENPSSTGSPVTGPIDMNVAAVQRPAAQPRRTET